MEARGQLSLCVIDLPSLTSAFKVFPFSSKFCTNEKVISFLQVYITDDDVMESHGSIQKVSPIGLTVLYLGSEIG